MEAAVVDSLFGEHLVSQDKFWSMMSPTEATSDDKAEMRRFKAQEMLHLRDMEWPRNHPESRTSLLDNEKRAGKKGSKKTTAEHHIYHMN